MSNMNPLNSVNTAGVSLPNLETLQPQGKATVREAGVTLGTTGTTNVVSLSAPIPPAQSDGQKVQEELVTLLASFGANLNPKVKEEMDSLMSQLKTGSVANASPANVTDADIQKEKDALTSILTKMFGPLNPEVEEQINIWGKIARGDGSAATDPKSLATGAQRFGGSLLMTYILQNIKGFRTEIAKSDIDTARERHKDEHDKNLENLKESRDAMQKAEKSGVFNKIFGWISTVLTAVIGVLLIATGVGTALGATMLAGAVIGALEMIPAGEGKGGLISTGIGEVAKACGASEETAKYIGMGITLGVNLLIAGVGMVAGGAGFAKLAETFGKIGPQIARIMQVSNAVQGAGNAATGTATAVTSYQAASAQASVQDGKAEITDIEAWQERLQELIEALFAVFQSILTKQIEVQGSQQDTAMKLSNLGA